MLCFWGYDEIGIMIRWHRILLGSNPGSSTLKWASSSNGKSIGSRKMRVRGPSASTISPKILEFLGQQAEFFVTKEKHIYLKETNMKDLHKLDRTELEKIAADTAESEDVKVIGKFTVKDYKDSNPELRKIMERPVIRAGTLPSSE